MKRETFILTQKKWYRYTLKLYLKTADEKIDQRNIKFTTEHKVSEKERNRNARKVAADYSTADEKLIDGLYRDPGYGKTFVHIDDPEGERKLEPFIITPIDARKMALRNLFKAANLDFDQRKSAEVLTEEYNIHVSASTGVVLTKGEATEIVHEKRDVVSEMQNAVAMANEVYEEKYNEPIPDDFKNDLGFLSALSDPKWDAKAYIAERQTVDDGEDEDVLPETAKELQEIYFKEFGKNVANIKKNDTGWIKARIEANRTK